ncbi:MAG: hypothetical protein UR12_C0008G0030 [candidate division TM6 bacterium GW2011_GWF2_30_66]|nr:MAG: hypothetical protein UR12_C0008G0030 [candidate division TM6 bacterium GW2011_GWF2_30_66]
MKKDAKRETIMNKKTKTSQVKSTADKFLESLDAKEKKQFFEEYKELLLSELLLAVMEKDNISVRKLAKLAGVSPTVVQAMRSGTKKDFTLKSFFKILNGLGCNKLSMDINGQIINLDISAHNQKKSNN